MTSKFQVLYLLTLLPIFIGVALVIELTLVHLFPTALSIALIWRAVIAMTVTAIGTSIFLYLVRRRIRGGGLRK